MTPPTAPAPRVKLTNLPIGLPVYFHEPELKPFRQPRNAVIAGPGAQPDRFNITVFTDPFQDMTEGRMPPVLGRKNIAVYASYPDEGMPVEPFAVLSPVFMNPVMASPAPAEPDPRATRAAGRRAAEEAAAAARTAADEDEERETEPLKGDTKPPARETKPPKGETKPPKGDTQPPTPAEVAPKNGKPKGLSREEMGALNKLTTHPAYDRENADSKARVAIGDNGLEFRSTSGLLLARVRYRLAAGQQGYELWVPGKTGSGVMPLVQKAEDRRDVARVVKLASRIGRAAAHAERPNQVQKAIRDVQKRYENPPRVDEEPGDEPQEDKPAITRGGRRVVVPDPDGAVGGDPAVDGEEGPPSEPGMD